MNISVIIPVDDLHQYQYNFWFYDNNNTLYLDGYYEVSKQTKRHHWCVQRGYDRLSGRYPYPKIPLNEVPFNEDIKEQAKKVLIDSIQVKFWEKE
jgi:hypothetical protein